MLVGFCVVVGYARGAELVDLLITTAIITAVMNLSLFVARGLGRAQIEVHVGANESVRRSARSAAIVGVATSIILFLASALIYFVAVPDVSMRAAVEAATYSVVYAGPFAVALALAYGFGAVVQHWVIRLILCLHGHTPITFARWLDHAVSLRLLYRNGSGGYVFIHGLLQEYFATQHGAEPISS
jgi:hypothetical protein